MTKHENLRKNMDLLNELKKWNNIAGFINKVKKYNLIEFIYQICIKCF